MVTIVSWNCSWEKGGEQFYCSPPITISRLSRRISTGFKRYDSQRFAERL
jgi:hypothetical protein